jgi:CubicO group peptidase (beta-lactamase class C family)
MSGSGLSSPGVERIHRVHAGHIDSQDIPGMVALVSHAEIFFGRHSSWGFGMAVDAYRREIYHTPGRFGWTGGFGTTAYTDPAEELIRILFTQRMMGSPDPPRVFSDFWTLAFAAME